MCRPIPLSRIRRRQRKLKVPHCQLSRCSPSLLPRRHLSPMRSLPLLLSRQKLRMRQRIRPRLCQRQRNPKFPCRNSRWRIRHPQLRRTRKPRPRPPQGIRPPRFCPRRVRPLIPRRCRPPRPIRFCRPPRRHRPCHPFRTNHPRRGQQVLPSLRPHTPSRRPPRLQRFRSRS